MRKRQTDPACEPATTLTLTTGDGCWSACIRRADLTVDQVVEELIEPVLLAAGYHPRSVREALGGDMQTEED